MMKGNVIDEETSFRRREASDLVPDQRDRKEDVSSKRL
jgi:hypothetical protein